MFKKFNINTEKITAAVIAFTACIVGMTVMTTTQSIRTENETQSEASSYTSPSAGLSTQTLLSGIDADDAYVNLVSVSSVAQTNIAQQSEAVEVIAEAVAEIEDYVETAKGYADEYSAAEEAYETAAGALKEANEFLKAAMNADIYVIADMYAEDVTELVETAANASEDARTLAQEAAVLAAEQAVADERQALVDYALSFVGVTPYSYGGTSLTSGADCSGFVMAVYAHFGYSLPHSSSAQAYSGTYVSLSDIEIGDIVCYYGHVGIYIGNGKIVHSPSSGKRVCTQSMYYMKIKTIRRIIN